MFFNPALKSQQGKTVKEPTLRYGHEICVFQFIKFQVRITSLIDIEPAWQLKVIPSGT
jgi:hypothetical protein